MPVQRPGRLPAEAHFIHLLRVHLREIQARSNGVLRKPRVMFHPAEALFGHGKQQLAVAHDARRGIMHLRIINPQCQHRLLFFTQPVQSGLAILLS